jgi:hypothetical protein
MNTLLQAANPTEQPAIKSGRIRVRKPARLVWGPREANNFEPVEVVALLSHGCAVHSRIPVAVGTILNFNYNGIDTPVRVVYCLRRNKLAAAELGLTFNVSPAGPFQNSSEALAEAV